MLNKYLISSRFDFQFLFFPFRLEARLTIHQSDKFSKLGSKNWFSIDRKAGHVFTRILSSEFDLRASSPLALLAKIWFALFFVLYEIKFRNTWNDISDDYNFSVCSFTNNWSVPWNMRADNFIRVYVWREKWNSCTGVTYVDTLNRK